MAINIGMVFKFATLLNKLQNMVAKKTIFEDWRVQHLIWIFPLLLAIISFGVEDHDVENDRFHLARNAVKCQFRYASILDEVFLLHIPMFAICALMAYFIGQNMKICLKVCHSKTMILPDFLQCKPFFRAPPLPRLIIASSIMSHTPLSPLPIVISPLLLD
jgi:hypothetical protein